MKKTIILIGLLLTILLFLGCTQSSICGDTICSPGEENTCPTDCATQINGTVFVNVVGANDATDLTLEYYSSSNVNYNFYSSIVSSLASNWNSNNSKNLSISLNQNDSVTVPVLESRQIVLEGLKQGEYYFTARNSEYSYFGKAEKVLINEDKDYYVTVELKANQPIVKVTAFDESGNTLMGSGRIEIFEVTSYYDPSTQNTKTTESQVAGIEFSDEQEIIGLFNLWPERSELNYQTHFKAVVTKDNYGVGVYDYLGVQNKYNGVIVKIVKETPKTGSLKIQIIPGQGTTLNDLEVLKGKEVYFYETSDYEEQKSSTINSDLTINLTDYKVGTYRVGGISYAPNTVPVQLNASKEIIVTEGNNYSELEGFLGLLVTLSVLDSQIGVIPAEDVQVNRICYNNIESPSCSDFNENTWTQMFGVNPYTTRIGLNNLTSIEEYSKISYVLSLSYNGQAKDFNFSFKQGVNDIVFKFEPAYSCVGEIDPNALLYAGDDLGLTANTAKVLVNMNTSAKCEYYCNEGYYLNLGKCVLGPDDRNARLLWGKATPFAITEWNRTRDKLYLSIKNISSSYLYLKSIYLTENLRSNRYTTLTGFSRGQTKIITIKLTSPCLSDGTYKFLQSAVKLRYSTYPESKIITQKSPADILGRCN